MTLRSFVGTPDDVPRNPSFMVIWVVWLYGCLCYVENAPSTNPNLGFLSQYTQALCKPIPTSTTEKMDEETKENYVVGLFHKSNRELCEMHSSIERSYGFNVAEESEIHSSIASIDGVNFAQESAGYLGNKLPQAGKSSTYGVDCDKLRGIRYVLNRRERWDG